MVKSVMFLSYCIGRKLHQIIKTIGKIETKMRQSYADLNQAWINMFGFGYYIPKLALNRAFKSTVVQNLEYFQIRLR
jgi:hypothetical protein